MFKKSIFGMTLKFAVFVCCCSLLSCLVHDLYSHMTGGVLWNPWLDKILPFVISKKCLPDKVLDVPMNSVPKEFDFTPIRRGNYYFRIWIPEKKDDFEEQPYDICISCEFVNKRGVVISRFRSDGSLCSFWTWSRDLVGGSILELGRCNVPGNIPLGEICIGRICIGGRDAVAFMKAYEEARLQLEKINFK